MRQRIVALVGISGVGKTTFLKQVAANCVFQHLTAGSVIARAKAAELAARDSLRLSDLDGNQRLLIQGFATARDPTAYFVILDGHVVIHTENSLLPIESWVFASLGINEIAHLEADPAQVHSNRAKDANRQRPSLSVDEIRNHQARSSAEARRVADDLRIEFKPNLNSAFSKAG